MVVCMNIVLMYFDDCPNWKIADARLAVIAAERADLSVSRHRVDTPDEAERVGFHGSPSIMVDGVDAFAGPDTEVGLSCRLYGTPDGLSGAPTINQLRAALTVLESTQGPLFTPKEQP